MMTARGCGHCAHSRGNGVMGTGAHFMKPSALDEFLSLGQNYIFMNIHFDNMSGKRQLIREISTFEKQEDKIVEEMWVAEGESTRYFRVVADMKTKKMTQDGVDDIGVKWLDFINRIPLNIENYTYYYPCFMITKTENWNNSAKNNVELYALTNAGKTRIKDNKVFLDKDGKSFNERMVDPKDLIRNVISGKEKIEPHIKDEPKQIKTESKVDKKLDVPKRTPIHTGDYIIRQY